MADYETLKKLSTNSELIGRVQTAITITANDQLQGTPTTDALLWATSVLLDSRAEGRRALNALLADNAAASEAAILAALDSTMQTKVDTIAPFLITAHAARG